MKKSSQIIPALKLMDEALRRAPGQEIPLSQRQKHTPMKRYIAVDAEFKEVTIDENSALKKHGQTTNETRAHLRAGLKEQLCSVLTIAVDRHLVFSFYLLDMLQNPESDTVANVRRLNCSTNYLGNPLTRFLDKRPVQGSHFEQGVLENMVQFPK